MAEGNLQQKLVDYIEDAHAMEQNVLQMLDSMIATTRDDAIVQELEHHRMETERHEQLLRARLGALGRDTSIRKEAQSIMGALMKGAVDQVRGDKAGKNARDGFVTEHMEIAAYELLERLALLAGDADTALVARQNKQEEQAMAKTIASNWDRFLALTLVDAGIEIPKPVTRRGRRASDTGKSGAESKEALYERAKKLRIPGRSSMTKEELARAIAERG